jgi:glutamate-5-semialdehyde dehydrogenase
MNYQDIFFKAREASRTFTDQQQVDLMLKYLSNQLSKNISTLLVANQKDLDRMSLQDAKYDRLKLTPERIADIANDMYQIALLPPPLGRVLEQQTRPNGLIISKISAPFGVVGIIYESRPNVTFDVFSLCIKSGNACVLKGGSEAQHTNEAAVDLIKDALTLYEIDPGMIALLPAEREATTALLNARGDVDILIPSGSQELIDFVCENAKIPVIETGSGIVHIYYDKTGKREQALAIVNNAKTRRDRKSVV